MAARYLDEFSAVASGGAFLQRQLSRGKERLELMRREGPIHGEVHDSNAYFLDGVSGAAGLFSCAADIIRIAEEFLPRATDRSEAPILSPESILSMVKPHCEGEGQRRGLGWQLIENNETSGGHIISRSSFGHTAFTGCSLWIDPLRKLAIVLLSNAVRPTHRHEGMRFFRPMFHDLVVNFSDCIFKPAHA